MTQKRIDQNGQELFCGERQRADGRYEYIYRNREGLRKSIYAYNLSELRVKESGIMYMESVNINKQIRNLTLNDQFELWIASKQYLRRSTLSGYRSSYDCYIRNSLGKKLLFEITTFDIKAYYSNLKYCRRLSEQTVSRVQNIMYQTLQSGVDNGVIPRNPAEKVLKGQRGNCSKHKSSREGLYLDQANALLDHIADSERYNYWYPMIYTFINTGLRISELAGLRWCDIDLEDGYIDVNHALVEYASDHKSGLHINLPKTPAGARRIPLSAKSISVLKMEKNNQLSRGLKCNASIDDYTDFVFLNKFGGPVRQADINRFLVRIVDDYNKNCRYDKNGKPIILPKITTHWFRHTFANILCQKEVSIKTSQRLLGHDDISTTMDIYTHVSDTNVRDEFLDKWDLSLQTESDVN